MGTRYRNTLARAITTALVLVAMLSPPGIRMSAAQPAAPGGFVESATSPNVRSRTVPTLPSRGPFTFPAPYGTTGVRITNASDCGGNDCVTYVGYSYWRNTNNHVGSDTMLLFLTLDRSRGGSGPTLFSYDKRTDQVSVVGPLFDSSSSLSWATGEGWYFSATQATKLYVNEGAKLYRYDVLARTFETVFDASTQFGSDKVIWQIHSSDDDRVHSATLRASSDWSMLGCFVYQENTRQYSYFPAVGDFDECQIDPSGRWLLIKENVDGRNGEDNVIVDLTTGAQTTFLDEAGAAGHSDSGFGYMVAEDNFNNAPGAIRLWSFGQPFPSSEPGSGSQGLMVYQTTDWSIDIGHLSHTNARADVPAAQQYACGGGATRARGPRTNEIQCFPLDGSMRVLVVAPVMTDLDAPGGGSDDYVKMPKGNLDITGQYFIWTSNVGGSRLDAFIVKVPSQLLSGVAAPPVTGPSSTPSQPSSSGPTSTPSTPSTPPTSGGGTPPGSAGGAQPVVWTNVVNAAANGGSLQKQGGCDGCDDAGAVSQQQITSGSGYVEFVASETSLVRYVGLTRVGAGSGAGGVDFALRLQSGYAEVREGGAYRTDTAVAPGDMLRVAVESGTVRYYKNGAVFYTSTVSPGASLEAAAALLNSGSGVSSAVISTSGGSATTAATPAAGVPPSVASSGGTPPDPTPAGQETSTDPASSSGIQLALGTDRSVFTPGDTFQISFSQANTGAADAVDAYFSIALPPGAGPAMGCPAGDAVVYFAAGFSGVLVTCASSTAEIQPLWTSHTVPSGGPPITTSSLFNVIWPPDAPAGTYTVSMKFLPPGAPASSLADPDALLGVATLKVTFAP